MRRDFAQELGDYRTVDELTAWTENVKEPRLEKIQQAARQPTPETIARQELVAD